MPTMLRAVKMLLANINYINIMTLEEKDLPSSSVLLVGAIRVRLSVAFIVCFLRKTKCKINNRCGGIRMR